MNEQKKKMMMKKTFDAVSSGYDIAALRFFPESARILVELLDLRGNEHVLDVATGTGHVALAAAQLVPQGHVTAVDLSSGMLDQARRKAAASKVTNVEFLEMDMQALEFPQGSFDAAVCAFGIFFAEDMNAQLQHIADMVEPGGSIALTSFQVEYFSPLVDMMFNRLEKYGVGKPPQTWKEVATVEGCTRLLEQAGISNIRVERKNMGYFLHTAEEWLDIIQNAGFRRFVSQLSSKEQENFKREHMHEIGELRTSKGIWLDVGVLFSAGVKP